MNFFWWENFIEKNENIKNLDQNHFLAGKNIDFYIQKLLEAKFGIPQDQQRIVREAFMYSGPSGNFNRIFKEFSIKIKKINEIIIF